MKKAKDNLTVAHQFATVGHDTYEELQGSNFFFSNGALYSYGYHFMIAKFVTFKGERTLLANLNGYSNSTAKHISLFRSACSHINKIWCYDPAKPANNIEAFENALYANKSALISARKKHIYLDKISEILSDLNRYIEYLKEENNKLYTYTIKSLSKLVKSYSNIDENYSSEDLQKEREKAIKAERAVLRKLNKVQTEKFLNHESRTINITLNSDILRVSKDQKTVETSKGVSIPIKTAKTVQIALKRKALIPGMHIDSYTIKSIDSKKVVVGCHTFKRSYLENFKLPE